MAGEAQTVPVRVYDREQHIVLAAPMPGLEAENISVDIVRDKVVIMGEERGPRQHGDDVVIDEWTIGPYHREVLLPHLVDGEHTNATYGNGVLVLTMPKCNDNSEGEDASFQLHPVAAARGERIGHTGMAINPSSTLEHELKHQLGRKA
ncbi:MAG TPA: Hsp20/alpha crystallin family protein [Candidatus Binatia bacterium]